jgi:hypothetical protein
VSNSHAEGGFRIWGMEDPAAVVLEHSIRFINQGNEFISIEVLDSIESDETINGRNLFFG